VASILKNPFALTFLLTISASAADPRGDNPDAKSSTPAEQLAMFHLPPGFEIQLVAAEPEIQKPLNITFDTAGRLWVTGSEMYPWPASTDAQGKPIPDFAKAYDDIAGAFNSRGKAPAPTDKARDTVRVLSDFDETGHARKVSVFAEGLNIPSGVQPLPRKPGAKGDTVIVYSIPNIYRLEDTDGDGRADTREVLYGTSGYLDTHGGTSSFLYWIDGWIYGTHGFRNHSEIRDRAGHVTVLDSGNTYRFRPDGSAFEIYTHGQTNPFGLTADPSGNLYSADSHSKPVYMLLRGGCYEGIGKQHDGLGFAPRITEDDHGSTAIAGISFYAATQFPEEYRGNLFNGNPVTRRINRDKLEWHGSTPIAIRQPDFLTCDDPWFRPVQVKLGPDGALYIADFYNPIIGHYEVPLADPRRDHAHGRIWRVVWRGDGKTATPAMPDLASQPIGKLRESLSDSNFIVRTAATHELVARGGTEALDALKKVVSDNSKSDSSARSLAWWGIERLGGTDNLSLEKSLAATNNSPEDTLACIQMLRILADRDQLTADQQKLVAAAVSSHVPAVARAAADALGRHPGESSWVLAGQLVSVPADDVELKHTLRMALRDFMLVPGAYEKAMALDATQPTYAPLIADVSLGANTSQAGDFLLWYLKKTKLQGEHSDEYLRHVILFSSPEKLSTIPELLDSANGFPLPQRLLLADKVAQAYRQRGLPLSEAIVGWTQRVMIDALATGDDALLARAIESLRETKLDAKLQPLSKIATDPKRKDEIRAAALEAMANLTGSRPQIQAALRDASSLPLRKKAVELFNGYLETPERQLLIEALSGAPGELAITIAAALATTDVSCGDLITTIENGKAAPSLLINTLVAAALEKRSPALRKRAAALTRDLPAEDARLDQLIATRAAGFPSSQSDPARGARIFSQQCSICHRRENNGGNIGPALDGVGARGLHRLTEDILDPNRNVDPIFRQTIVETTGGRTFSGLNAHEEGELLLITDATGKPISIPKAEVKSRTTSKLSLMPAAFETMIPVSDFNDLISYLLGAPEK
jgi:putative membrane-bound dehydrogenase-like protein